MSTYKGQMTERKGEIAPVYTVTVDSLPLEPLDTEVPAADQVFGWGHFSPWANCKLLAYSIISHELSLVMRVPHVLAYKDTIAISDAFLDDRILSLPKQWVMTSNEIRSWIQESFPAVWEELHNATAAV